MKLTLSSLKGLLPLESEGGDMSSSPLNLACPPFLTSQLHPGPHPSLSPPPTSRNHRIGGIDGSSRVLQLSLPA